MKVLLTLALALALSADAQTVSITNTGNELISECAVAVRFMDTGDGMPPRALLMGTATELSTE